MLEKLGHLGEVTHIEARVNAKVLEHISYRLEVAGIIHGFLLHPLLHPLSISLLLLNYPSHICNGGLPWLRQVHTLVIR